MRRAVVVALAISTLLSTVAVACTVRMATVTGPDGNQWQTCDGNDARCIATIGKQCGNGYVLGYEKQFNCKPRQAAAQGQCVTDQALEPVLGAKLNRVRGPDCRLWLMCRGFGDTGRFDNDGCLTLIGKECGHGYIVGEVFGEAMYQCKSPEDAGPPDAISLDAIAPADAIDSQ